ncbi:hypothetical protein LSH36_677g02005 [Paralvinella palmiformis]|uniref:Neurotransmitter-gated ion-channel transmembrane domain-containing protein n=1 Tax=Paralvinella palmiformis TaxID=53620 RepID=A0AAD9J378_9ANNE|nr:hypothetical protein LSH36_677g02005 [Paralvinella palmiformis]
MTLGTISVCMTVLVLNVHHRGSSEPVPLWAKKIIFTFLARLLCVTATYNLRHKSKAHRAGNECRYPGKRNRKQAALRYKSAGGAPNRNGTLDLDELELMGLTANHINKPSVPVAHAHGPLNGPRTTIPVTPPSVINERRRYGKRRTFSPFQPPDALPVTPPASKDYTQEWHELAHVLDRLFFWVLFLCMTMSAIFTLLYPKYSGIEEEMFDLVNNED